MNLSATAKNMIRTICISALIIIALGAIFFRSIEGAYFAIGAILISGLNVLKVILLERSVEKAAGMDERKSAANFIRLQYLLRFLLTGVVLVVVALCPYINLWGAVAGIFTLPIAAFFTQYTMKEDGGVNKKS